MLNDTKIQNTDELEFAVFCIENIAIRLGKKGEDIYQALTEQSDILNHYIIPGYEMLHTKAKITSLMILSALWKKGVSNYDLISWLLSGDPDS